MKVDLSLIPLGAILAFSGYHLFKLFGLINMRSNKAPRSTEFDEINKEMHEAITSLDKDIQEIWGSSSAAEELARQQAARANALGGIAAQLGSSAALINQGSLESQLVEIDEDIRQAGRTANFSILESLHRRKWEMQRILQEQRRALMQTPSFRVDPRVAEQILRFGGMRPGNIFIDEAEDIENGFFQSILGRTPRKDVKKSGDFKDLPEVALPKHLLKGAVKLDAKQIEERVKWQVKAIRGK